MDAANYTRILCYILPCIFHVLALTHYVHTDLLDKATRRSLYLGLVDIIFAYAYNYRTTEGENSVSGNYF